MYIFIVFIMMYYLLDYNQKIAQNLFNLWAIRIKLSI